MRKWRRTKVQVYGEGPFEAGGHHLQDNCKPRAEIPLNAMESGVGPHCHGDTGDVYFEEVRMPEQTFCDQSTGLELDPDTVQDRDKTSWTSRRNMGHLNQCNWPRLLKRLADNVTEQGGCNGFNKGASKRPEQQEQDGGAGTRRTSIIEIGNMAAVT